MVRAAGCPLCEGPGGVLLGQDDRLRIIRALEPGFPVFYRVVWTDHVAELSDLSAPDLQHCMDTVVRVERLLRDHLRPDKVNLAALGNQVPHLHWHVIGRFGWDSRFPAPVWAPAVRPEDAGQLASVQAALPALDRAIGALLAAN
jgi:diadenosine tetraphosphate (Ap4A) HIT family hydrolase